MFSKILAVAFHKNTAWKWKQEELADASSLRGPTEREVQSSWPKPSTVTVTIVEEKIEKIQN